MNLYLPERAWLVRLRAGIEVGDPDSPFAGLGEDECHWLDPEGCLAPDLLLEGTFNAAALTDDQRVVRLYLTEAGTALLARAPSPARGVLPEALRLLDPEALARLQGELDGLLLQIRDLDEGFGMQPLPFTE